MIDQIKTGKLIVNKYNLYIIFNLYPGIYYSVRIFILYYT